MKAFVAFFALATVALAAPEADPQVVYAGYPYVADYTHATAGLTTYANGAVVPTDTLSVQAAKAQHFAAKAQVYATQPFGYAGIHYLGKREAEAKPEADAQFYAGYPYAYAGPHTSLGLTAYPNGAVTPTQTLAVQAATAQHFAAKASIYATQPYLGYAGVRYLGKREAEAEPKADADAQFLYSGYYPYAGYANYGFINNYAYPYRFLGKREAEPSANADSQYFGYGYGYPYATYGAYRGYYGYPYATYLG